MVGWTAAVSAPMTDAEGYFSAMSIAHIPDPVPRSRIFCGWSPMGAMCSWPFRRSVNLQCWKSLRSNCSLSIHQQFN